MVGVAIAQSDGNSTCVGTHEKKSAATGRYIAAYKCNWSYPRNQMVDSVSVHSCSILPARALPPNELTDRQERTHEGETPGKSPGANCVRRQSNGRLSFVCPAQEVSHAAPAQLRIVLET